MRERKRFRLRDREREREQFLEVRKKIALNCKVMTRNDTTNFV